jgi:hypothetical protein
VTDGLGFVEGALVRRTRGLLTEVCGHASFPTSIQIVVGAAPSAAQRRTDVRQQAPVSPDQLGRPIAYLALSEGTPVYDRNGNRVGVVEHVMDVGRLFEGLIIHTHPLPGHHVYADANQISEVRERGVMLSVDREELHDLRKQPVRRRRDGPERPLEARLRRAWDWIAGLS